MRLQQEPEATATDPAAPVRTTRRRADTRRRLIAAAYEVFAERGIADTPVEAICERAGFTRGAFYSNFDSKEALFLALDEEQTERRLRRLTAIVEKVVHRNAIRDEAALREAIAEVASLFMEPIDDPQWYLLTSEFHVHVLRQPGLRAQVAAVQDRLCAAFGQALVAALDRFGLTLTVPARDAVIAMTGVYEAVLRHAALEGRQPARDDPFLTQLLPQLLSALVSRPDEAPSPG
ncbi:TetR/AcrR family transcriptional regulator [Pseudonocardia hispaniensis]|uniref:TetR/AcrR family transcriptional regulator n=1 Tax=Pseudonocardia hispaniensis TaxID=904933 RepID=A0ABW1J3T1_9PSEU